MTERRVHTVLAMFVSFCLLGTFPGCQREEVEVDPSLELERTPREHTAVPLADPQVLPPPGVMGGEAVVLTEAEKIERMLTNLESSNAVFIRNGSEYSGREAADHLRRKWKNSGGKITTAQQFIDHLASKSSLSGKPYKVKQPDGTVVDSKAWFSDLLGSIEDGRRP